MGLMRFVSPGAGLGAETVQGAYLAGWDGIPWPSINRSHNGQLTLERPTSESGTLHIPWQVDGFGELLLASASLMEREQPYLLPVELARGAVSRLRTQQVEWEAADVKIPTSCRDSICEATRLFVQAAVAQTDAQQSARLAQQCLEASLRAMNELTTMYSAQALQGRRNQYSRLPTLMAVGLDQRPDDAQQERLLLDAFTWAAPSLQWSQIEPNADDRCWEQSDALLQWCELHQLRVCAGPLLRLDRTSLPDWIYLWEDDFEQLRGLMTQHHPGDCAPLRGKVHAWHAAAGINIGGPLQLNDRNSAPHSKQLHAPDLAVP